MMKSAAAAGALGVLGRPAGASAQVGAPPIMPRDSWGADLPPTGPLEAELPEDVRFLLVHHTASGNGYGPGDAIAQLQSFYRFHTGPEKGWPDIAYNFLIDRFGVVYEGRAGSIDAPIKADATGGSQGYAVLACFIGDLEAEPPTPAAEESMVALLTWLAARHGIDPQGSTTFTSRGSNRWPAGTAVTTATIAGHRDMSQSACPGQFGYALVQALPPVLGARLASAGAQAVPVQTAPPVTAGAPIATTPPATTPPQPTPTSIPTAAAPVTPSATAALPPSPSEEVAARPTEVRPVTPPPAPVPFQAVLAQKAAPGPSPTTVVGGASALVALVAAGLFDVIRRRGGLR